MYGSIFLLPTHQILGPLKTNPPEKRQKRTALNIVLGPDVNSSTVFTVRDELEMYVREICCSKGISTKLMEGELT